LIALSDHNACDNVIYAYRIGEEMGVKVIPAMELQTEEEVHLLAYFETLEAIFSFKDVIYPYLPNVKNEPEYFRDQVVVDEDENIIRFFEAVELSKFISVEDAFKRWPELMRYTLLSFSDAHFPEDIGSRYTAFYMKEFSFKEILRCIKKEGKVKIGEQLLKKG